MLEQFAPQKSFTLSDVTLISDDIPRWKALLPKRLSDTNLLGAITTFGRAKIAFSGGRDSGRYAMEMNAASDLTRALVLEPFPTSQLSLSDTGLHLAMSIYCSALESELVSRITGLESRVDDRELLTDLQRCLLL